MPKISELNAITSVANNDLLMVVHDPAGLPSTNKITVNNFGTSITSSLRYASQSLPGVIKVGENLSVNATGFLNANLNEGIYPFTLVEGVDTYNVANNDVIIFANPNSADLDITVILPTTGVSTGQEFLIKNIDPGLNHVVRVITDAGLQSNSNYLENPVTGGFIVSYDIGNKGESHTWIFDGIVYRHLAELSSSPVFYASTDSFHQVVTVNPSSANNASSDWVAYNNQGNYVEGTGPFVDMGINSNTYTDTTYGNVWGPSDAYLYNYGGNLIIGPQTDNTIKFIAGNTNTDSVKMTINASVITVNSNIFTTNPYFDLFGRNQAEISATSDGQGGGENQSYIWSYQNNTDGGYAEAGQYVQNAASYSVLVHHTDGKVIYNGIDNIAGKEWNYTIRPYDSYSVGIKPSSDFGNELVINPTADYDIHLFEGNTGGAITIGAYGATNFRVYGPGGANNGGGQYGNDIKAELYPGSSFSIKTYDNQDHIWNFDANGAFTTPFQYSSSRTGTGEFLKFPTDGYQKIIGTDNGNESHPTVDRIVISGGDGQGYGEGGDIYLWAGRSGPDGGSGGDIKVDAGNAYNSEGGTIKIRGGNTSNGVGGFIELWSGSGTTGAPIDMYTWNADTSGWNHWGFGVNGALQLPTNGDIKNSDGTSPLRDIPQNLQSAEYDYTLQYADRGRHILIESNVAALVPDNGTVAFPRGTVISIVSSSQNVAILPVSGSNTVIYNNGTQVSSTSGSDQGFYITPYTMATLLKVGDDTWILSAPNLQTGW